MSSSESSTERAARIRDSVASIKRRMGTIPIRLRAESKGGHTSVSHQTNGPVTALNIRHGWAKDQTDQRLQASLYHESMHVEQFSDPVMQKQEFSHIREFHAHARELRHAMKHNLFDKSQMRSKIKKLTKYAGQIKDSHPHLEANANRQLARVAAGKPPAKHSVGYWNKRLK